MVESVEYLAWMGSFPSSVRHVVLGKKSRTDVTMPTRTALYTSIKYCGMLRIVCPDLFPQLLEGREEKAGVVSPLNGYVGRTPNLIRAFPNMKLTVLPMNQQETSEYSNPGTQQLEEEVDRFQSELNNNPDFLQKISFANNMKNAWYEDSSGALSTKERNEVILAYSTNSLYFLGTGCAIPCKYRNVSGILLHLPSTSSMVLLVCTHTSKNYAFHADTTICTRYTN